MRTHDTQRGFILYSTLISITISTIVLTLLLGIVFYGVMWNAKLVDSVAMMEDGRYTRRMVVAQIIWNPVPITVEDQNRTLYIHDTKRTTLTLQRHALYRKLTDNITGKINIIIAVDTKASPYIKPLMDFFPSNTSRLYRYPYTISLTTFSIS